MELCQPTNRQRLPKALPAAGTATVSAHNQEMSGNCPAYVRKKGTDEDEESGASAGEGGGEREGLGKSRELFCNEIGAC